MNNRNLSFGSKYGAGPAPASVPPPQPLSFSSIGSFSGPSTQQARSSTMGMPGGSPGTMPGLPTTAGQFSGGMDTSLNSGLFAPVEQFSPENVAGMPQDNGNMFGNFFGADGFNMGDLGELTKMIGGFGNLYMGMQQNKLAKKSLNAQQDAYKSNLANQIASFNLALEDRMRSRAVQKNRSPEEAQANIDRHKL